MHKIIDNFIETNLIEKIKSVCLSSEFAWYYTPYVSNKDAGDGIYFSHLVYNNFSPSSSCFNLFIPVLDFLNAKSLIRIKINIGIADNFEVIYVKSYASLQTKFLVLQ